jgi:hypothetical protein
VVLDRRRHGRPILPDAVGTNDARMTDS